MSFSGCPLNLKFKKKTRSIQPLFSNSITFGKIKFYNEIHILKCKATLFTH